jgi:hypothetical protein
VKPERDSIRESIKFLTSTSTYSEALRDMRSQKIHEISVLFSSNGFAWIWSGIMVLKYKVMAYIGRSKPDHFSKINMSLSRFKGTAAFEKE